MRSSSETLSSEEAANEKETTAACEDEYQYPTDGGRAAWMFMLGSVIVDAVIWGFPLNFGIFLNYYGKSDKFSDSQSIAMIGTFATVSMTLERS